MVFSETEDTEADSLAEAVTKPEVHRLLQATVVALDMEEPTDVTAAAEAAAGTEAELPIGMTAVAGADPLISEDTGPYRYVMPIPKQETKQCRVSQAEP